MSERYSVGEFERRFLLAALPERVVNPREITDFYIDGTRLRLRLVKSVGGVGLEMKLGHKRRLEDTDPRSIRCTNLYLDEEEYAVLSALRARRLTKTRWDLNLDGVVASVDVFSGDLAGLILGEVDLGDPSRLDQFEPPTWFGPEVTLVEAFTGGGLAGRKFVDLRSDIAAATEAGAF